MTHINEALIKFFENKSQDEQLEIAAAYKPSKYAPKAFLNTNNPFEENFTDFLTEKDAKKFWETASIESINEYCIMLYTVKKSPEGISERKQRIEKALAKDDENDAMDLTSKLRNAYRKIQSHHRQIDYLSLSHIELRIRIRDLIEDNKSSEKLYGKTLLFFSESTALHEKAFGNIQSTETLRYKLELG